MKTNRSLHALFASLALGCGPNVLVDDTGSDDDPSTSGDDTTTASTTSPSTTSTTSTVTTNPTDPTATTYDTFDTYDDGCFDEVFIDVFEIPLSEIEQFLDENGQVRPGDCWQACMLVDIYDEVISCQLLDVGEDTATGGSDDGEPPPEPTTTTTATTGGTDSWGTDTGIDPTVLLECEWRYFCGGGRGHEALQPPAEAAQTDPVAAWAAATAHAEAASVPAFVALHRELTAHGAPEHLRTRALEAARDEIAHARAMTRIATRRGARVPRPRFETLHVRSLEAIAIENAVEGCVRETWAALEATYQAHHAADADIRAAMRRIADDETRHAQLALDIDRWLRTRLPSTARARVDRARTSAIDTLERTIAHEKPSTLSGRTGLPRAGAARRLLSGMRATVWA